MSSQDKASWSLNNPDYTGWSFSESVMYRANLVWDTNALAWVKMTQASGGGGGGGTQYADGTTQATPTGTVAIGKNPSNILHALSLDASGNLNVNLAAGSISGGNAAASPTGAAVPASADYLGFNSGGLLVGVSSAAPLPVSAASLPLPAGAATSANQATEIASLATIASNTTPIATGQKLMAASEPVVIASDQSSLPVTVGNFPASQTVAGTVTANQGGAPWSMKPDGVTWTQTGSSANVNVTNTVPVSGTFWQATQPVSGTVNANISGSISNTSFVATQPTGTNLHVVVDSMPAISGGNAAASATGSAVPASADYLGFSVGGNLVGVSAANPLPISGSISASSAALANAANPNWAEGSSSAFSQDLSGNLRVRNDALMAFQNTDMMDMLEAILLELKVNNELLKQGLNVRDDLTMLRADASVGIDSIDTPFN